MVAERTSVRIRQTPTLEELIEQFPRSRFTVADIKVGNKWLAITIDNKTLEADSMILKTRGNPKIGATTLLYERACEIMVILSRIMGKPINYKFITGNPSMVAWALDDQRGKRVFDWDYIETEGSYVMCLKRFEP